MNLPILGQERSHCETRTGQDNSHRRMSIGLTLLLSDSVSPIVTHHSEKYKPIATNKFGLNAAILSALTLIKLWMSL